MILKREYEEFGNKGGKNLNLLWEYLRRKVGDEQLEEDLRRLKRQEDGHTETGEATPDTIIHIFSQIRSAEKKTRDEKKESATRENVEREAGVTGMATMGKHSRYPTIILTQAILQSIKSQRWTRRKATRKEGGRKEDKKSKEEK